MDYEFGTQDIESHDLFGMNMFGDPTDPFGDDMSHDISMRTVFPDQWAKMNQERLKPSTSIDYFGDDLDDATCNLNTTESHPVHAKNDVGVGNNQTSVPLFNTQVSQAAVPQVSQRGWENSDMAKKHQEFISKLPAGPATDLVSKRSIGDKKFESLFKFDYFNKVQSACFDDLFRGDQNVLVSAPTGAGKTCLLEIAIVRLLKSSNPNSKIVYIAPTKALCDERARDWSKFASVGVTCSLLTGDSPKSHISEIQKSRILVTTPEKWDTITRQLSDSKNLVQCVRLLLVDEIHTLKDGSRGSTLEVVITRMKAVPQLRIVAISATVPNLEDFCDWLSNKDKAVMKVFGEEYRPVQLERHVLAFGEGSNSFAFEDMLKYKLPEVIQKYSQEKPTLVFCATRKGTVQTAEFLIKNAEEQKMNYVSQRNALISESRCLMDKKLASLVAEGVGYHHAGLDNADRQIIETLFMRGVLPVICTTSTLAVGVNLPARLVIIKGTSQYDFLTCKMREYSDHDILQMMGRAGRPQFDQFGVAVIMTSSTRKGHFDNLMSGKELIESSLHESLIEHLNAEVVLGTTATKELAIKWLHSTFLYNRIKKNPGYYRIRNCSKEEAKLNAENRLEAIFMRSIDVLKDSNFVTIDANGGIAPTEYAEITAKMYLRFQTAKLFVDVKPGATEREILETFCKSEDFNEIRFHNDKGQLNFINKNPDIRYPIKGKVATVQQKVSLCLQAVIGGIALGDGKQKSHTLQQDTAIIIQQSLRISRGMVALFLAKRDPISMINGLKLGRSIQSKMWSDSKLTLRQIEGVGPQIVKHLSDANIVTFQDLLTTEPHKIETLACRHPPFGSKILMFAKTIPQLDMQVKQINVEETSFMEWQIDIELKNAGSCLTKFRGQQVNVVFICGTTSGEFVDLRKYHAFRLTKESFTLRTKLIPYNEKFLASLICTEIVGIDCEFELKPINTEKRSRYFSEETKVTSKPLTNIKSAEKENDDDEYWNDDDLADVDLGELIDFVPSSSEPIPDVPKLDEPGAKVIFVPCRHYCLDKQKCGHPCCKTGIQLKEGYVPCGHFCLDKQKCSHICCKAGIPPKTTGKRKKDKVLNDVTNVKDVAQPKAKKATLVQAQEPVVKNTAQPKAKKATLIQEQEPVVKNTPVKKKATFVALEAPSDGSPNPISKNANIKEEFKKWKNATSTTTSVLDTWKSSKALYKSRSNVSLGNQSNYSMDSIDGALIDVEWAKLDYLHANACPAPLPSERIRVPSFHSQDMTIDEDEDVESILKQFL